MARIICDIANPDGTPFARLPAVAAEARDRAGGGEGLHDEGGARGGVLSLSAPAIGEPTTETHDSGGYFDLTPVDLGEDVRREIVLALEQMGFHVEAAHHEVAPGQHEIDFRYDDALITADNVSTFRFVVKNVANRNGLHATFMPKPVFGVNGSGMHTHQSLFSRGRNVFFDEKGEGELSRTCLHYIGGLLRHAKAFCAVTNPLVNSYKRLVPGYEAPTAIAWSTRNRSPLVRVPAGARRDDPDRAAHAGPVVQSVPGARGDAARGARRHRSGESIPGPPVNKNIYKMSHRERRHLRIDELPGNLSEALDELEKSALMRDTLGDHIFDHFLAAKRAEWDSYIRHVSPWEIERYLNTY